MQGVSRLAIATDLTIYNATELKKTLLDALSNCRELEIDLAQVAEIDTAGFQLLLLLKREAANSGKHARIVAHSAAVSEMLDFFNVAASFGDPLVIPASEHAARH